MVDRQNIPEYEMQSVLHADPTPTPDELTRVDVAVIGGGAAGLSGALVLARARRSVVVIDAGAPRNAPAEGVHGFLTRDGIRPSDLTAAGRQEVVRYGGQVVQGQAVEARRVTGGFEVCLEDGRQVQARRLLVTTGLTDRLPEIPGVQDRWGRDVLHCPYCHGWEFKDEPIGVLVTNEMFMHQALLFRQWTADVVVFAHTAPPFTVEQTEQLTARGIRVVQGLVAALDVQDDRLTGVRLEDGRLIPRRALVVAPTFVANSALLTSLGLAPTPHPAGIGEAISAGPAGLTSVPGVWVAGNVTDLQAQVVGAAAGGVMAAAAINADLVQEDTARAVRGYRLALGTDTPEVVGTPVTPPPPPPGDGDTLDVARFFTPEFWDERYGSSERYWSGNPNVQLVAQVADLTPGTVLDLGCGEGADAIWLAQRGWQVTGVDVSQVALDRAAGQAAAIGAETADRISWEQGDAYTWDPAPRQFDLVSAHFMFLPGVDREALHQRLAAAVRPGGRLLIVSHHPF
ncbi:MAG: methyltransferase domain-containing protein, partial [Chloroflexota bacterium]